MLKATYTTNKIECGVDEAGRGSLVGAVFAAAVILPPDFHHPKLNDSKKISKQWRNVLRSEIEKNALAYAVASVDQHEIDKINILNASIKAMHLAIEKLSIAPEILLIDGNRFKPFKDIEHQCIVGGDSHFRTIAAASILAKTYRDDYMEALHELYPIYDWQKNMGYGTKAHRNQIMAHGQSPYHRKSFRLHNQLKLNI